MGRYNVGGNGNGSNSNRNKQSVRSNLLQSSSKRGVNNDDNNENCNVKEGKENNNNEEQECSTGGRGWLQNLQSPEMVEYMQYFVMLNSLFVLLVMGWPHFQKIWSLVEAQYISKYVEVLRGFLMAVLLVFKCLLVIVFLGWYAIGIIKLINEYFYNEVHQTLLRDELLKPGFMSLDEQTQQLCSKLPEADYEDSVKHVYHTKSQGKAEEDKYGVQNLKSQCKFSASPLSPKDKTVEDSPMDFSQRVYNGEGKSHKAHPNAYH